MRRYTSGLEKRESAGYLLEANTPDSRTRAVRAGFVRIGEHLRRSAAAYGVLLPHILPYSPDAAVAVHPESRAIIVPATQSIYREAMREGLLDTFVEAGAIVSTPTCAACFGGHMGLMGPGENAVSNTNRNFKGRMGSSEAGVHLANAYVAAAVAGEIVDPADVLEGFLHDHRGQSGSDRQR